MTHQRIPQIVLDLRHTAAMLASIIDVSVTPLVSRDGLYVGLRSKRDPINANRKRQYVTVRFRRDDVEVFREDVPMKGFPSDHLIAQLMLVK
jgi:hypothetical protein